MDTSLVGRAYGPTRYEVGAEKIREYALAISGAIPSRIYPHPPPADLPAAYWDSAGGPLTAPPTFCVTFAIQPFVAATLDAALGIDLVRLVHGEQEFEFGAPVRAGDVLTTTGTLSQLFEKSGKEFVVMSTVTHNDRGEEVVRGTWTAVVRK
jgi:hypothetical protein